MGNAFCAECELKSSCKKVCKKVEQWLRKQGIRRNNWTRPQMPSQIRKGKNKWREINLTSLNKEDWERVKKAGYNPEELGYNTG